MTLEILFDGLCDLLVGDTSIERHAKAELQRAKADAQRGHKSAHYCISLMKPTLLTLKQSYPTTGANGAGF